jgi:hypothetical protein
MALDPEEIVSCSRRWQSPGIGDSGTDTPAMLVSVTHRRREIDEPPSGGLFVGGSGINPQRRHQY